MNAHIINAISIVIPVHNESGNVEKLAHELQQVEINDVVFEYIFVDDHSNDDTAEILRTLARQESRLRVLQHQSNYGQSTAVRTGIKAAQYDWICTLDGDGQNDPADIHKLVERAQTLPAREQPMLVSGNRQRARKDTFIRRVSSKIANNVRARLLGDSTPDSGCGLKLIDRAGYLALPYFDHMHRFLPSLVLREGGAVYSVHISHRDRTEGTSHYGILNRLWVGIVDILGVAWLKRRAHVAELKEEETIELKEN